MTTELNKEDTQRFTDSIGLSNDELRSKINEQLQREKAAREIAIRLTPKWMKQLEWDKLMQTKLFNTPKI